MNVNHFITTKIFEKGVNSPSRGIVESNKPKKRRPMCLEVQSFFCYKISFEKRWCALKIILKDLDLLIVKNHLHVQFVKNVWLKHLTMHLCQRIVFSSKNKFSQKIFPKVVEKMKQLYVLPILTKCYFIPTSSGLWMLKSVHHIFALVINFLGVDW